MKKFFIFISIMFVCITLMVLNTNLYSQVKKLQQPQTVKKVDTSRLKLLLKTNVRKAIRLFTTFILRAVCVRM